VSFLRNLLLHHKPHHLKVIALNPHELS
jgi:hypothetical protein